MSGFVVVDEIHPVAEILLYKQTTRASGHWQGQKKTHVLGTYFKGSKLKYGQQHRIVVVILRLERFQE